MSWDKILKKKKIEVPNFKQAIKIAGDAFSVDTVLNFTEPDEDVRKFIDLARQAYANLEVDLDLLSVYYQIMVGK